MRIETAIVAIIAAGLPGQDRSSLRDELLREVGAQRQRAQKLQVTYRYPVHYSGRGGGAGVDADVLRTIGLDSGNHLFYEAWHEDSVTDRDSWTNWTRYTIVDGNWLIEWPNKLLYCQCRLNEQSSLPEAVLEDPFVACTGWWPLDSRYRSGSLGEACFDTMKALRDQESELDESPDGAILVRHYTHGMTERIELSRTKGWAVTSRRWEVAGQGVVLAGCVLDHREVMSGVWLPTAFTLELGDAAVSARLSSTRLGNGPRVWKGLLVAWGSCDCFDNAEPCRPRQLPGLARLDERSGEVTQVVAGGLAYLDKEGDRLARARRQQQVTEVSWSSRVRVAAWAGLLTAVLGYCLLGWRRGAGGARRKLTREHNRRSPGPID